MRMRDEAVREIVSRKWSEVGVYIRVGISQLATRLRYKTRNFDGNPNSFSPSGTWNATVFRSSGTEKNVRTFVKNDDLAD
jgi:hypothetical protein